MNRRNRRGEANFVALRLGFWHDPRLVLGLARDLKIPRGLAGAYVAQWEEFVLEVGDARTGRVKGYSAEHIAAVLDFPGRPARLVDALKKTGVLSIQRGTFVHPFWLETRTGQYALKRCKDAERQRPIDATLSTETPRSNRGDSADDPTSFHGRSDSKEGRDSAESPPTPLAGGVACGRERWAELLKIAPRPQNPRECIPLLERLSAEDWELVQFVYALRLNPPPNIGVRKRAWTAGTDRFLKNELFLNFRQEWVQKLEAEKAPKKTEDQIAAEVAEAEAKRLRLEKLEEHRRDKKRQEMRLYLVQEVTDPDKPERVKEAARKKWQSEFPSEAPPWEVA
jgi:hypothetical protein